MSYSRIKWVYSFTVGSMALLGIAWVLWGDLNEYGVREGGFLNPTAYQILKKYHNFDDSDEQELHKLANENPEIWKEISGQIKEMPNIPIQKRMDVLYPIYKGKNAQFPRKIIDNRNWHFLDMSYRIHFQINPHCFYVSPKFKEMVQTEKWLHWQIKCVQSLIQLGADYGKVWKTSYPVSPKQAKQMQENISQQILSGNLDGYKQLFPFGYMMNEQNEYKFVYRDNNDNILYWTKDGAHKTPYSFVLKAESKSETEIYTDIYLGKIRVREIPKTKMVLFNESIIGKMDNNRVFSLQNSNQTLLFHGVYNKEFFQRLSLKITQMSHELSKPLHHDNANIDDISKQISDWTVENEKNFQKMINIKLDSSSEFKMGESYMGDSIAP